jgi:hypothetical protein
MKIEKYIFCLPAAMSMASTRLRIDELRNSEIFILYAILYLPIPPTQYAILRHAKRFHAPLSPASLSNGIAHLLTINLISYTQQRYHLTHAGRDYLYYVRRYLVNQRL